MVDKRSPTKSMFVDEDEQQETRIEDEATPVREPEEPQLTSPRHNILELPSNGKHGYPAEVEYRDILLGDEEVLAGATPETYARTLNNVIRGILNDCPFFDQLTVFDRDYILVWLWANNYGIKKDLNVTCPHCGNKDDMTVDMTRLPVSDVKDNLPVPFTLPLKNATVTEVDLYLMTVGNELEVEKYLNEHPKADFEIVSIVSTMDVGMKVPLKQKMAWARENIDAREMATAKDFHRYFRYGVDDTVEHTCSECQEVTPVRVPFQTEDVLRPAARSDFEDLLRSM